MSDRTPGETLMRCADARPYLSAYADGELAEPLRAQVAAHIAGCADCRAIVQRAREVDRLLASLPRTTPSPEVYERVQAAVARRGLDPVVREPLAPSRWAQEIGVGARAVKRLLTPRVVYPQEPARGDDETQTDGLLTPFRRRAPWAVGALPAVAALLLIALSLALFNGLGFGHPTQVVDVKRTPPPQVGKGLQQAEQQLQRQEGNVTFTPVMPTYLPSSARLSKLTADKASDTLVIVWAIAATSGVNQMSLREAPASQGLVGCQDSSVAFGGAVLQWGLPNLEPWTGMICDGQAGALTVGQQRPAIDIAVSVTPRASGSADLAIGQLRIASLSMDTNYLDQINFENKLAGTSQPNTGFYLHYMATASDGGQQWMVTGETNTPYIQPNGHRLERITMVTGGQSTTDIVNGPNADRFWGSDAYTYTGLTYPATDLLATGPDGEPSATAEDGSQPQQPRDDRGGVSGHTGRHYHLRG